MNKNFPSTELIIRPASFNDVLTIQQIAYDTWPAAYEPILGKQQLDYMLKLLYSERSLEDQLKKHHYFFLALKDFAPIGFASFSKIEEGIFKLQKLYVLPQLQKTGAGIKLLQTVETVAKSMGAIKLQLNVNRNNIARSFYEKNGFTILREEDIDIGNNFFMNDFVMQKLLL